MNVPKPTAPKPTAEKLVIKTLFVRKPHLTDRPFKDHKGLAALRSQLTSSTTR